MGLVYGRDRSQSVPEWHAVQALNGTIGLRVDWDGSRGLNEYERRAIELAEERGRLAQYLVPSWARAT
jgi:hypothetical protein